MHSRAKTGGLALMGHKRLVKCLSFDGQDPMLLASETCGLSGLLAQINDAQRVTNAVPTLWLYRRTGERSAQGYAEIMTTEIGGMLATRVYWQSGLIVVIGEAAKGSSSCPISRAHGAAVHRKGHVRPWMRSGHPAPRAPVQARTHCACTDRRCSRREAVRSVVTSSQPRRVQDA